jgi:nucleotide-binding universal stress UspA family protein
MIGSQVRAACHLRCSFENAAKQALQGEGNVSELQKPWVVVVGIDYSESADGALDQALDLVAHRRNAELHAVHVLCPIPPPLPAECVVPVNLMTEPVDEATRELEQYLARKLAAARERGLFGAESARVVAHVRLVMPAYEIAQLAADLGADLVVIGSTGRRQLPRLILGSVAEEVVRLAPCPVLVVRPKCIVTMPSIEPACSECVKVREGSQGEICWCAQHSERRGQRQIHHPSERAQT